MNGMKKLFICSDIHGDAESAKKIIDAFEREECDKILILGDILYHGPRNDLPCGYAPKKVIELLNCYKEKIIAVRGNCDAEVDQMVLEFPILADSTRIYVDGICIFATHGHIYNKGNCSLLQKGDVLLHGHTHVPAAESFGNGNYYINPGSTSIPKENSYKGYIVYQNREFIFKTLEGDIYNSITV